MKRTFDETSRYNKSQNIMKMIVDELEYAELYGAVHCFCFGLGIPLLGNCGPKSQNCQFQLEFGT